MNEIVLQQPDSKEFESQASLIEQQATDLVISTPDDYSQAGQFLVEIKSVGKRLLERFADPCSKAQAAWKSMVKMRDEALRPFESAESVIKNKMGEYNFRIEEKRRKEAEKLRIEAEKKARAKRDAEIAEARRLKDKEAEANLKAAPLEVIAVAPKTPELEKAPGVSYRKVWKVQSVDAKQLPARYLMADMKAIEATVRGLGGKHGIPGVVAIEETITSVRS